MNFYKTNINKEYIPLIINGLKKHEFRLNNDERKKIKIGDCIILSDREDVNFLITVLVTKRTFYKSWYQAISENFEDFSTLFNDVESAYIECEKYYKKEDVDRYGIVAFEIKYIK